MAEELQHLLETIQKEGIEKAESDAKEIISRAKKQAGEMIDAAKAEAKKILDAAEKDAGNSVEHGNKVLEQASRDVLISLGQAMEFILKECVLESVGDALTPETLRQILIKMTEHYFDRGRAKGFVDLYLNKEDEKALATFFTDRLREKVEEGLEVHPTDSISKGFQISFRDQEFHHDFTRETIAEELCRFLRPQMREIVHRAIQGEEGKQ